MRLLLEEESDGGLLRTRELQTMVQDLALALQQIGDRSKRPSQFGISSLFSSRNEAVHNTRVGPFAFALSLPPALNLPQGLDGWTLYDVREEFRRQGVSVAGEGAGAAGGGSSVGNSGASSGTVAAGAGGGAGGGAAAVASSSSFPLWQLYDNSKGDICWSYPHTLLCPASFSVPQLKAVASFRAKGR